MKNILFISLLLSINFSCSPDDASPTVPITSEPFDVASATLLKQGELKGVNHNASGVASLYELSEKKFIVLDPYMSDNGPDLKIYLSEDEGANNYLRLGNLKSTTGSQFYEVPVQIDMNKYHYVHVWCEKYSVVFGRAELRLLNSFNLRCRNKIP